MYYLQAVIARSLDLQATGCILSGVLPKERMPISLDFSANILYHVCYAAMKGAERVSNPKQFELA